MKVQIHNSGNPANDLLKVYDGLTLLCDIYDSDFYEILNKSQIKKFMNGEYKFDIPKCKLIEKAKHIY
jgi:hypothetical protein